MRIRDTIYLDHQATTPVDNRVLAKMLPYFGEKFGNPHSADHVLGWEAARATEAAAGEVGRLIGADTDEIVFTSGATEANNLALFGLVQGGRARTRRRALLSSIDHKSALAAAWALGRRGLAVTLIPVHRDGHLDLGVLEQELNDDVLLVSLSVVNSEIGTIQKLEEIAPLVRRHGALLHGDAAQAPCAMDTTVLTSCCDLLSLSAHKIYGPKGIGALYIRRDLQEEFEPMIEGGGQQRNLRSGTVPTPLCVGFGAAAAILSPDEARREQQRIARQRDLLVLLLHDSSLPISLNGPEGESRHPGNANLRFAGLSAHDLLARLQPKLAASTGSACLSGVPEPSYVLRALGLTASEAECSIRFSIGRYTSDADIHEAARLLSEVVTALTAAGMEVV